MEKFKDFANRFYVDKNTKLIIKFQNDAQIIVSMLCSFNWNGKILLSECNGHNGMQKYFEFPLLNEIVIDDNTTSIVLEGIPLLHECRNCGVQKNA